jgi:hypothetical protein
MALRRYGQAEAWAYSYTGKRRDPACATGVDAQHEGVPSTLVLPSVDSIE